MSNPYELWTFTYDANGMRTSRSDGNGGYTYIYNGDQLQEMRYGYDILYFSYDANGVPQTVTHNTTLNQYTTVYQYVTNQQGDVIGIQDYNGNVYATYSYNAWGVPTSSSDSSSHMIEVLNPLRYRGYVYDQETGLYYLQSRYYNPRTGRFLNADDTTYLGADGTTLSFNLFAYCKNNPVMNYDPSGCFGLLGAIIATGALVGGLMGAFSAATTNGNVLKSIVKGSLTGAIGAFFGLSGLPTGAATILAALSGAGVDFLMQLSSQYIEKGTVDLRKVNYLSVAVTGIETGIGTAIPKLGEPIKNSADAFGTALVWAEGSVVITCVDVAVMNLIDSAAAPSSKSTLSQYSKIIQNGRKYVM